MHFNKDYILKKYGKWGERYFLARDYYIENKDLLIPKDYKTKDNISLGNWIQKQRNRIKEDNEYKLTNEQIALLNDIGMIWSINEWRWLKNYEIAKSFYLENNHLRIPYSYEIDGMFVGKWLHTQRKAYKNQSYCKITAEHIEMLNKIGMVWEVFGDSWEQNYNLACDFYNTHKHCNIPSSYITSNGEKLGLWIWTQRKEYKNGTLCDEKINLLNKISMNWNNSSNSWNDNYKVAKKFFLDNGHLLVKQSYKECGISLGNWINQQRQLRKKKSSYLSLEQIELLDDIHMVWDVSNKYWYQLFEQAETLYKDNSLDIDNTTNLDKELAQWIKIQKNLYLQDKLSEVKANKLKKIGFGGKS